jgi:hypothetical protein
VPFTIPNVGDAGFTAQARVNATDIAILAAGSTRSGVASGVGVTTTGAANGSVTVAAGVAVVDGVYVTVASGNVAISANSSGNPRRDLVTIDATGAKSSVVGTPGAEPLMPTVPASRTALADVYVPNGHSAGSTIAANQITDKRLTIPSSDFQAHNVIEYGAVGDSHHNTGGGTDDTAAIQAAYAAAQGAGGFGVVVFPGGRTYGISDTIETVFDPLYAPVWTWGVGSMGFNRVVQLPNIVWNGAAGGTMFNTLVAGSNLFGALYRNVRFAGRDIANTAIRFGAIDPPTQAAKIDSGTGLDEVHLGAFAGNAISVEGLGATNFWIRGGRWDRITGYALYMKIASQTIVSIRDVTWDGHSVVDSCAGFAHFDGGVHAVEGTNNTHYVTCHMDSVHWESDNLSETIPGATEVAGRRGVIRCTIDSNEIVVQHKLKFTNCQNLGWHAGAASHSLIQMDGGASNDERKARLSIKPSDLFGFFGDGSATLGHSIPIGNCGLVPPLELASYPNEYLEISHRFNGGGVVNGNYPRVWNNTA